jgi:hypothetical protein
LLCTGAKSHCPRPASCRTKMIVERAIAGRPLSNGVLIVGPR